MKIEIEIGLNLKEVMDSIATYANRQGLRPGEQIKTAFGLNLTELAIHLGTHKQAIEHGMSVTVETKKPA